MAKQTLYKVQYYLIAPNVIGLDGVRLETEAVLVLASSKIEARTKAARCLESDSHRAQLSLDAKESKQVSKATAAERAAYAECNARCNDIRSGSKPPRAQDSGMTN